jgi:metal-responsive CopG/Arc/MetJ family transcriptional regulator
MASMTRTTVYFPLELQRELRDEARRSGTPQAELIRAAVEAFLRSRSRPVPRSIGVAESGALPARDTEAWLRQAWADR